MKTMTTEDLEATWLDDQQGEYIQVDQDSKTARLITRAGPKDRIEPKYGSIWAGIRHWSATHNFWPNVWSVNDHGNVTLWTQQGRSLGGLV